jgi:hypothetical protein
MTFRLAAMCDLTDLNPVGHRDALAATATEGNADVIGCGIY